VEGLKSDEEKSGRERQAGEVSDGYAAKRLDSRRKSDPDIAGKISLLCREVQ